LTAGASNETVNPLRLTTAAADVATSANELRRID
jgi:hypothetical protein